MTHKWSKEAIVLEILNLCEVGDNLNYSHIFQNYCPLLRAAIRYFGTWEAAVSAAGPSTNAFYQAGQITGYALALIFLVGVVIIVVQRRKRSSLAPTAALLQPSNGPWTPTEQAG